MASPATSEMLAEHGKLPFDLPRMVRLIRQAVKPYPKAAMFELAARGYTSPFEQLVACIISIRTRDEVSLPVAEQLFRVARTPADVASLDVARIDELIGGSTFHRGKAAQIHRIASRILREHGGQLPCDEPLMRSFPGVGPKCAHLTLGVACGEPFISVDVHVHRVTNRWGLVHAATPEQTMDALAEVLPRRYWVEINAVLVPFGKHICTARLPRCGSCPIRPYCRQVGVRAWRG